VSAILVNVIVVAGVAALDAAFIPAAVIVLAGLWTFVGSGRRGPLFDPNDLKHAR
jgi:hypothetical protein